MFKLGTPPLPDQLPVPQLPRLCENTAAFTGANGLPEHNIILSAADSLLTYYINRPLSSWFAYLSPLFLVFIEKAVPS